MNFCTSVPEKQNEKIFGAAFDKFFSIGSFPSATCIGPRRLGRGITNYR